MMSHHLFIATGELSDLVLSVSVDSVDADFPVSNVGVVICRAMETKHPVDTVNPVTTVPHVSSRNAVILGSSSSGANVFSNVVHLRLTNAINISGITGRSIEVVVAVLNFKSQIYRRQWIFLDYVSFS